MVARIRRIVKSFLYRALAASGPPGGARPRPQVAGLEAVAEDRVGAGGGTIEGEVGDRGRPESDGDRRGGRKVALPIAGNVVEDLVAVAGGVREGGVVAGGQPRDRVGARTVGGAAADEGAGLVVVDCTQAPATASPVAASVTTPAISPSRSRAKSTPAPSRLAWRAASSSRC